MTLLTLLLAAPVVAQSAEIPPEAREIWAAVSAVESLEASFTLVRHSALLSRPLESKGTLRFARPDRLAWIVETPAPSSFVLDQGRVGVSFPDQDIQQSFDLGGDPEMRRLVEGMMVWLGGDLEQVQRSYTMAWTLDEDGGTVALTPIDATVAKMLGTLSLRFSPDSQQVPGVTIHEPDGDSVEITFEQTRLNVPLGEDAFRL